MPHIAFGTWDAFEVPISKREYTRDSLLKLDAIKYAVAPNRPPAPIDWEFEPDEVVEAMVQHFDGHHIAGDWYECNSVQLAGDFVWTGGAITYNRGTCFALVRRVLYAPEFEECFLVVVPLVNLWKPDKIADLPIANAPSPDEAMVVLRPAQGRVRRAHWFAFAAEGGGGPGAQGWLVS